MEMPLLKRIEKPNSRFLVFTSAGEKANLHFWLKGKKRFDLWICYYGDEENRYSDQCEYYIKRKGGKFPNLHYIYRHWSSILDEYEAILVMDDDIVIRATAISRLFEIRQQYDLWLLQAAFNPLGKISHAITQVTPSNLLRYTNFVEVTCPLFRKDKLDAFMKIYDPLLVGWGVDWWFLESLGEDLQGKVAIVDAISCINPGEWTKGKQREIELLQEKSIRISNWEEVKKRHNIKREEKGITEYGAIKPSRSPLNMPRETAFILVDFFMKWARWVRQGNNHT